MADVHKALFYARLSSNDVIKTVLMAAEINRSPGRDIAFCQWKESKEVYSETQNLWRTLKCRQRFILED